MNFLRSLGNWALFLTLAGGAIVVTYIAGMNLGSFANLADFSRVTLIQALSEMIMFVTTVLLTGFALEKAWKELGTSNNGFSFGIVFSVLIAIIITIRVTMLVPNTAVFPIVVFSMLFLLSMYAGYQVVPAKHQILLIFFGRILVRDEIRDGIAWILPFAEIRIYDMTRQTLNLTKRGEDIPMFPNGTRLKEFELIFMYHLKANNLHKLIYLGENWKYEIEVVINDSIPPALIALSNSITIDELKEKFFNSYSIALLSNSEMFKFVLFHGAFFASIKDFPDLVKNSFWKKRACDAFDDVFMAQKGYFPKVISKQEKQHLIYLNKEGNKPHDKILRVLFVKTSKEKIDYVIKNDLSVCVFDKFQENNLVLNGVSIHNLKGIFYKTLELGIMPVSLNLLNIQATDDIKAQAHRNELENVQRKAELQSAQTHSMILKELKKYGIDDDLAVVLAAKIQGIEGLSTHEIKKHKFEGNSDLSKVLAGLSTLLSSQKGDK